MKKFIKIVFSVIMILVGLRMAGLLLLFMDTSSDLNVIMGFLGLAAIVLAESLFFWVLFFRNLSQTEKETQ